MPSLKRKLLLVILPLCLIPLIGISFFSYFQAKERITEDRIVLYLEQIAQGLADTISLTLLERQEETLTTGLVFSDFVQDGQARSAQRLLDRLLLIHQVYDIIVIVDINGKILLINTVDRNSPGMEEPIYLDAAALRPLIGRNLTDFTPNPDWLQQVRSGRFGFVDWHVSPLVDRLYHYRDRDVAFQYSIGFAAPITDDRGVVVGGILSLMNWFYIQDILDHLEAELEFRSLRSGYAFLFAQDSDTIIAHKYRRNRDYPTQLQSDEAPFPSNYGTSLTRDHHLDGLSRAVRRLLDDPPATRLASHFDYEYPEGVAKISGLAAVDHDHFEWVCGVGINDEDIFAPVQELKNVLILAALLSSALIVILTFSVARQITIPLKKLTMGASVIAGGDLSQRVEVSARDETGELAKTFNEMAESLQERSQALLDLNRQLEAKVEERTRELQKSHAEARQAYLELKDTQVQLVQSEKMASLGQLVAGIAHEIKNPLNFIYGNTDFLKKYVEGLKALIHLFEEGAGVDPSLRQKEAELKKEINYDFIRQDLDTLIENLEEGAKRIHAIIGDLRTFSRMDSDELRPVDIHEPMELALNLLRHEYRDRISVHKDFGQLPKVECHSGKLSQVFMNVLANACQAINGNGEIQIRTFRENGRVVIEVEDNGEGIEEAHLNKVFEPFFTTKPVGKGTGLGLSISYGIIRQHHGTISVQSRKNQGTTFRIELPVK